MHPLAICLLIFLAGGCGAVSRYGLTLACARLFGTGFPFGTMAVNILGCFFFGFVYELAAVRALLADAVRVALCVGFMGSFTTFSSLVFDSWALASRPGLLALNLAVQAAAGFGALCLGTQAARLI